MADKTTHEFGTAADYSKTALMNGLTSLWTFDLSSIGYIEGDILDLRNVPEDPYWGSDFYLSGWNFKTIRADGIDVGGYDIYCKTHSYDMKLYFRGATAQNFFLAYGEYAPVTYLDLRDTSLVKIDIADSTLDAGSSEGLLVSGSEDLQVLEFSGSGIGNIGTALDLTGCESLTKLSLPGTTGAFAISGLESNPPLNWVNFSYSGLTNVDYVIAACVAGGASGGSLSLQGCPAPSAAGLDDINLLVADDWAAYYE